MCALSVELYRYPQSARSWRSSLLVLGVVLAPLLVALVLLPELRSMSAAASVAGLAFYPVVFVSAMFLYLYWRLTYSRASLWLTAGLTMVSAHGLALCLLQTVAQDGLVLRPIWLIGSDVTLGLAFLAMTQMSERGTFPLDPTAIGVALGLLVASFDVLVSSSRVGLPQAPAAELPGMLLLIVIGVLLVPAIHGLSTLPAWGRDRLALAAVTLAIHRVLAYPPAPDGAGWHAVMLLAGIVGSALLCRTTLAMLRTAIHDDRREIRLLHDLLASSEMDTRDDHDRMHQIRSAVAGIASASHLIHTEQSNRLPKSQVHLLTHLVDEETSRLQRLLEDDRAETDGVVELDGLLRPLATELHLQGKTVRWTPSGHRVRGSGDRIAEVIRTLLDNADAHAAGSPIDIEVRGVGSEVEIVVADSGPGVPPELQPSIFERGSRGEDSTGQGIGLHMARRLMEDAGNTLCLDPSRERGAAFVLRLESAGRTGEAGP